MKTDKIGALDTLASLRYAHSHWSPLPRSFVSSVLRQVMWHFAVFSVSPKTKSSIKPGVTETLRIVTIYTEHEIYTYRREEEVHDHSVLLPSLLPVPAKVLFLSGVLSLLLVTGSGLFRKEDETGFDMDRTCPIHRIVDSNHLGDLKWPLSKKPYPGSFPIRYPYRGP